MYRCSSGSTFHEARTKSDAYTFRMGLPLLASFRALRHVGYAGVRTSWSLLHCLSYASRHVGSAGEHTCWSLWQFFFIIGTRHVGFAGVPTFSLLSYHRLVSRHLGSACAYRCSLCHASQHFLLRAYVLVPVAICCVHFAHPKK